MAEREIHGFIVVRIHPPGSLIRLAEFLQSVFRSFTRVVSCASCVVDHGARETHLFREPPLNIEPLPRFINHEGSEEKRRPRSRGEVSGRGFHRDRRAGCRQNVGQGVRGQYARLLPVIEAHADRAARLPVLFHGGERGHGLEERRLRVLGKLPVSLHRGDEEFRLSPESRFQIGFFIKRHGVSPLRKAAYPRAAQATRRV